MIIPVRAAPIGKVKVNKCCLKDVEKVESSYTIDGNISWGGHYGKLCGDWPKIKTQYE